MRSCKTWVASGYDLKPLTKDGTDWCYGEELIAQGNTLLRKEAAPDPLLVPIRFQGQREDAETGLFYNRFRYYEPLAGQYCSVDPIRLRGGLNPHSYVLRPTNTIDGFGLAGCCAPLKTRHDPCSIKHNARAKARNTQIDPSIDVAADVEAIMNRGDFVPGQDITVNGRTYGSHHKTGRLFPRTGPGFHNVDRAQFKLLGQVNSFGLEEALNWAANNPVFANDPEKLQNTLDLWKKCP